MGRTSIRTLSVVIVAMVVGATVFMLPALGSVAAPSSPHDGHCWVGDFSEEVTFDEADAIRETGDMSVVCVLAANMARGGGTESDVLSKGGVLAKTGSNAATAGAALAFIGIGLMLHASALRRQGA